MGIGVGEGVSVPSGVAVNSRVGSTDGVLPGVGVSVAGCGETGIMDVGEAVPGILVGTNVDGVSIGD